MTTKSDSRRSGEFFRYLIPGFKVTRKSHGAEAMALNTCTYLGVRRALLWGRVLARARYREIEHLIPHVRKLGCGRS